MKNFRNLIPAVLSGVLGGLAWQHSSLALLMWIALVPFFYSLFGHPRSRLSAWLYGFLFGFVYYGIYFCALWALYPMDWLGITPGVSFLTILCGVIFFSFIQAFWLGMVSALTVLVKPGLLRQPLAAACLWVLAEFFQSLSPLGFTGAQIGVSQYLFPAMIQGASLFGALFVSFIIVLCQSLLASSLLVYCRQRSEFSARGVLSLALALLVFFLNLAAGYSKLAVTTGSHSPTVKTAIVQGGLSSTRIWDAEYLAFCSKQYETLTLQAGRSHPKIIVWPETAVPIQWVADGDLDLMMRELADKTQAQILAGAFYQNYNSILVIDPDHQVLQLYHKQRLAPFGEFLPFKEFLEPLLSWLEGGKASYFTLSAGSPLPLLQTDAGPTGSLICFEGIFSDLARGQVLAGAESLVISTNDSWFDGTAFQPSLLGQAVFRAVENNRYVVRASSTGISALIDEHGRILSRLPSGSSGTLSGEITPRQQLTFFTQYGNVLIFACAGLYALLFLNKSHQ